MATLDNCSECGEDLKVTAFSKQFYCGYCINMFAWSPDTWTWKCTLEYLFFSQKASAPASIINRRWLERGRGQQLEQWWMKSKCFVFKLHHFQSWCSFQFSVWFFFCCHLFDLPLDTPIPLIGNGKHYSTQLLSAWPVACLSQRNAGIKVPRMENTQWSFLKWYLLMHACASRGKMLNCQQNSCLLLVVVWSKSWSREEQQHFIWLCVTHFCQKFPICSMCGRVKIEIGDCWVRTTK